MVGYCVTDALLYCIQATKDVNNMTVKMPYQCFINGQFEDAENGKTYDTINPTDGSVSHKNTPNPHTYHKDANRIAVLLRCAITVSSTR